MRLDLWGLGGLLALVAALLGTGAAHAQRDDTDATLDALHQQLEATQQALGAPEALDDSELLRLRGAMLAAQSQADGIASRLAPEAAQLDARIAQLGSAAPGTREDADLSSQRTQLTKSRNTLGDALKLARLLAVEAQQLANRAATVRRSQFQARLGERTDSILSVRFWSALADDLPRDATRLQAFVGALGDSATRTPLAVWIGAPLAAAFACWALWRAMGRVLGWLQSRAPAGRLRRSLHAAVLVAEWTGSFGAFAVALPALVDWHRTLPKPNADFLASFAAMLWFFGFIYGLATALISARKPSWRLPPLPDPVAASFASFPWLITLASLLIWVAERLAALIDASFALTVAIDGTVSLALGLIYGLMVMRGERLWRRELARHGTTRPVWLTVAGAVSWMLLAFAVLSLCIGYVAFGSFVVKQIIWTLVLLGAGYLLAALIDDGLTAWVAAAPDVAPTATELPAPRLAAQLAVLGSGVLRLTLALVLMMLLLVPFGESPLELLRRGGQWQRGLSIGEFALQPGAVLQALLVLLTGLGLVRLMRRWLEDRYLPTTSLDPGMRSSATSLFGYMGVVVAVALALSAMGIGLERIAWVASALSVGIGFGLQAVVQNFVSGLILLAERPVKVGDWVSLGGIEGDVRRINVRATEIQQGDRSTVIVPNSEFITKTVRNVTLANPLGLVQLKLPLPLATDAEQVRALLLEIFEANEDLLDAPAPSVALDGIENGSLVFNATGFVDSPRKAYNVRSAVLFEVLRRFGEAGIALAKPPTMLLGQAPAPVVPSTPPP